MNKFSSLAATAALVLFANASLACDKPASPVLPDPATAGTPEMVKAKNDVKGFLAAAEAYLGCGINDKQHNKTVDEMKAVADGFNQIIRAYKARMAG